MKAWIIQTCFASLISLGSAAFAQGTGYFAPERLTCRTDQSGELICLGFNRTIFKESTHTSRFPGSQNTPYFFVSGMAHSIASDKHYWRITFEYQDKDGAIVRLNNIDPTLKPDFQQGIWFKKVTDSDYYCNAGYRSCLFN